MKILDEKIECISSEGMRSLQLERLQRLVEYLTKNSQFYQGKLEETGVAAGDIRELSDLTRLPFTVKADLRDNYPFGMFAVPMREIAEIHASSGTTGNPTVVAYTKKDIELWSMVMARAISIAGGTPDDIVQNAYGYGLFTGGLGVHYGALELGASVVPISSGGTKRQLKLMHDFGSTIITCTPSYALFMAEEAREMGYDPRKSPLKVGILGAEPWSDNLRREIEAAWDMTALDIYGLSEIIGPGVAQECPYKNGLHIFSDVFLPEIIDPVTGRVAEEGESGELIITTLTKEAMPLLRYRTGDIVTISHGTCECGRTLPRISKILGRTDDMLIIRGINVFPSQIESVLLQVEGARPHYQLVVDRIRGLDTLEVQVEVGEELFSDEIKQLQGLKEKIRKEIESVLALVVDVKLVEPKTIARSMGKAKRVIDRRSA
ncbi:MAG TPA: phenylacetate--CoA ligase family protein [Proteobacteria bacterium]|nr:phenylacetate--CoA ligase family protein [Pseudomonadota bacterium]